MFLSTDSHVDLPKRQIDEGLARGTLIHCGFDNDNNAGVILLGFRISDTLAEASRTAGTAIGSG